MVQAVPEPGFPKVFVIVYGRTPVNNLMHGSPSIFGVKPHKKSAYPLALG
jgi:hypothetical protein